MVWPWLISSRCPNIIFHIQPSSFFPVPLFQGFLDRPFPPATLCTLSSTFIWSLSHCIIYCGLHVEGDVDADCALAARLGFLRSAHVYSCFSLHFTASSFFHSSIDQPVQGCFGIFRIIDLLCCCVALFTLRTVRRRLWAQAAPWG